MIDYIGRGTKTPNIKQDWIKADAAERALLARQEEDTRHSRQPRSEQRSLLTPRGGILSENASEIN